MNYMHSASHVIIDKTLQAVERGNVECPICLSALERGDVTTRCENDDVSRSKKTPPSNTTSQINRKSQHMNYRTNKPNSRHFLASGAKDKSQYVPHRKTDSGSGDLNSNQLLWKQKALLSCSHVFHQTCLQAFEDLAEGERRYTCPVCRAHYQKKILN